MASSCQLLPVGVETQSPGGILAHAGTRGLATGATAELVGPWARCSLGALLCSGLAQGVLTLIVPRA